MAQPTGATNAERNAKERLVSLLQYTKEIGDLHNRDATPRIALKGEVSEDELVLHESFVAAIKQKQGDGPLSAALCCDRDREPKSGVEPTDESGLWLRVRRPTDGDDKTSAAGQMACRAYAALFSVRQEAQREGSERAQLAVGVGLVRWQAGGSTAVDHPLVIMPADLDMERDGALVVRMAGTGEAWMWGFPGVARAQPALLALTECAKAYGLLGAAPPPPTSKLWEPLLQRAANTLAPDGRYVDGPPPLAKSLRGALRDAPTARHLTRTTPVSHRCISCMRRLAVA